MKLSTSILHSNQRHSVKCWLVVIILLKACLCASAQDTVDLPLYEEWDTYSATSSRNVNGWLFCKTGIDDESIVQRNNLHAFLTTGSTAGSGTVVATPYLSQVPDTFSFRLYGSSLNGHMALVEFGFIPDSPPIGTASDICGLFVPYDTVSIYTSNQWFRTTVDLHPYFAIHGTTHRFAIRLINSYHQELYLDELRAWIPADENTTTCPDLTTKGRDFWVTFFYNYHETEAYNPGQHIITAIGDQDCSVDIFNNATGNYHSILTNANQYLENRTVGDNAGLPVATAYNGGYHVTSTEDIWLYASNYVKCTQDAAVIIPTAVLDTTYIIQDYPAWQYGAQVAFVATEDNTVLTMTVPCNIQGTSITAGTTLTPTLMQGQSYMLISNGDGSSFSGMRVTSNGKPFAAFQGGRRVKVPTSGQGSDLLYEQVLPMNLWGQDFIVGGVNGQACENHVRITSSSDHCVVTVDGATVATLNTGQTTEITYPQNTARRIQASAPVCVILYLASYINGGRNGDPSSVTIPPLFSGICDSRFKTCYTQDITNADHFVTIICDTAWDHALRFDGAPLPTTGVITHEGYCMHQLLATYSQANLGLHHLENSEGPFIAYAYGRGYYESYAFPLGFRVEPVPVDTTEPYVPEIHRDTVWLMDTVCQGQPYNGFGFTVVATQTANPGNLSLTSVSRENDTLLHYHILTLTIMPTYDTSVLLFLIPGDTLFFLGDTLTEACQRSYTLQTLYGCDSLVNLTLNYALVSLSIESQGGCPGSEVTLTADGTRLFYWSSTPYDPELDSQQGQNPITVHPTVTTVYHLLDASGNVISSVTVGVEPPPTLCVEIGRDFIDFDHPVITLHDCSPDRHHSTWVFSDGYTMHGERIRRQFRHPLPDTVTVTLHSCNQYECCADTTIGFHPEIRSIWFPNIFTPNEPQNNRFGPVTSCQVADFEIYIYNRWGLLVFHSTDIQAPWDGTHDGTPVPQGAYAYQWYLKDIHGDRWNGTGTVTLIR